MQIFEAAGFASAQDATKVSVALGGFKLLMTGKSASKAEHLRGISSNQMSGLMLAVCVCRRGCGDCG